jgi:pre-mRNA cleavage complex 2 protein Pcf11
VSQDELAQILAQLRALVRPTSVNPAAPPTLPTSSKYTSVAPYPPLMYNQTVVPAGTSLVHPQYSQPNAPTHPNSAQFQISDTAKLNPVASTVPPPIPNITGLFEALVKAGVVSATSTPTGAGATVQAPDDSQSRDVQSPSESHLEDARAYRKAILAVDVRFSSTEISRYSIQLVSQPALAHTLFRHRPNIVHFLYERVPVQCKQCGLRFSDTVEGKKTMQEHLDMHFRQNRKASQSVGRGHCRSWFLGVEVSDGI